MKERTDKTNFSDLSLQASILPRRDQREELEKGVLFQNCSHGGFTSSGDLPVVETTWCTAQRAAQEEGGRGSAAGFGLCGGQGCSQSTHLPSTGVSARAPLAWQNPPSSLEMGSRMGAWHTRSYGLVRKKQQCCKSLVMPQAGGCAAPFCCSAAQAGGAGPRIFSCWGAYGGRGKRGSGVGLNAVHPLREVERGSGEAAKAGILPVIKNCRAECDAVQN